MRDQGATRMPIKPLIPIGLAAFAGFLNLFGMNPFFVDIAEDTGSSVSMVGYTATAALLITAIAGLIVGPISERIGLRRTLVAGLILAACGAAATALAVNFGSLVLARLLTGAGGSITGGVTVSAAALIYSGRQRHRALAIVTASAAMAVVVGIFLMTLMAEPYGWRGAYLILSGILVGVALLNRVMLAPDDSPASKQSLTPRELLGVFRPLLGDRSLRRLFVGATVHPAVLNGSTAYIGAFLVSQHETSMRLVGLVFSLIGITYIVGNLVAGSLVRVSQHAMFSLGVLLMGCFWVMGYVLPVPPLMIAALFGLATFAAGVAWVTLLNTVAERATASIGTAMVLTSSLLSLGAATGIAISAGLLDITSYQGVAIGMGVLAILGAIVGWVGPPVSAPASESERGKEAHLPLTQDQY